VSFSDWTLLAFCPCLFCPLCRPSPLRLFLFPIPFDLSICHPDRRQTTGDRGYRKKYSLGVARGPFNATVFFLTLAIALSGMTVRPSFKIGVTSTSSHAIGAYLSATSHKSHTPDGLAYLGSFEDLLNTLGDFFTYTISWNKSYKVVSLSYQYSARPSAWNWSKAFNVHQHPSSL
jgi:hypothetical protein